MPRLGFKGPHSEVTKQKISDKLKGKHPVGFKKKKTCPNCNEEMSCPNLPRHLEACLLFSKYGYLFPNAKTLRQFKHAKVSLKLSYKIDLAQYLHLYESQKGLCKICLIPQEVKTFHVDHCHITKEVRGLLCARCNLAIGMFKDDIEILKSAIKYLSNRSQYSSLFS